MLFFYAIHNSFATSNSIKTLDDIQIKSPNCLTNNAELEVINNQKY